MGIHSDPVRYNRREFLSRSGRLSLALPLLSPVAVAHTIQSQALAISSAVPEWVVEARKRIPAAGVTRYFQTAGIAPSSTLAINQVISTLADQNRYGPVDPRASRLAEIEPALRAHVASVFGAEPEEIALTHSTSEGINIASWSLDWKEGDEVIISNQEHPANIVPWYNLRDRFGIVIREIDLGVGTDLMSEVQAVLSESTRMVSVSHVSRNNGRTLRTSECSELGSLLRERGIIFHLDGAQGPGCVPVHFRALGCTCYSTCGHKWLLGPKGTGVFFVRREHLEDIRLSWTGSHSHDTFDYDGHYTLKADASRFEFGTRAVADFAGLDRALSWFEELGMQRIQNRIQELVTYAGEKVNGISEFDVASPTDPLDQSGVFLLRLPEGCDSWDIYNRLREEEYVHTSPVRTERDLRIALHFFNTIEEIDATLELVRSMCTA